MTGAGTQALHLSHYEAVEVVVLVVGDLANLACQVAAGSCVAVWAKSVWARLEYLCIQSVADTVQQVGTAMTAEEEVAVAVVIIGLSRIARDRLRMSRLQRAAQRIEP